MLLFPFTSFVRSRVRAVGRLVVHAFVGSIARSFVRLFVHSFMRSVGWSFMRLLFDRSFVCSLVRAVGLSASLFVMSSFSFVRSSWSVGWSFLSVLRFRVFVCGILRPTLRLYSTMDSTPSSESGIVSSCFLLELW